jgi:hypothetical protein
VIKIAVRGPRRPAVNAREERIDGSAAGKNAESPGAFVLSGSTATLGSELSAVSLLSLKGMTSTRRRPVTTPI